MNSYATSQTHSAFKPTTTPTRGILQRACACGNHSHGEGECAECKEKREMSFQRAASSPAPVHAVPPIVHEVLHSPGQPLDALTRAFMEPRFGQEFSHVRVHTDTRAAESAQTVNALAYTVGRDIVFGRGQYAPSVAGGRKLLAHELTHTLQQSAMPISQALTIGDAENEFEREAEQISTRVTRGEFAPPARARRSPSLDRQAAPATAQPAPSSGAQSQPAQPPAPTAPAISTVQNIRVRNTSRFDAELDRRAALDPRRRSASEPCRLTLTVRVRFNFNDTQTPNRWTSTEQTRWQNEFIRAVTDRWSFRFLLVPSQPCPNEPCQLAATILHIQPVASNPHNTMNVLYDKPSGARSSVGARTSRLYREDVERPGSDLRRDQTTATHEAGHLLGLPHVHCSTNDDDCYGTNREESADVMGRGEIVTAQDYAPFLTAMQQITGCSWQVRDGRRGPLFGNTSTLLGITLGIFGGIIGGVLGAAAGPLGAIFGALGGAATGGLLGYGIGSLFD